jgi:hypothetical protein
MKRTKTQHNSGFDSPEWYFLTEYALDEVVTHMDHAAAVQPGLLRKIFNDMGVPPELVINIERYLTGFMKRVNVPGREGENIISGIRVYCHKKAMDELPIMRPDSSDAGRETYQPERGILGSSNACQGSWGYFLVERAGYLQCTNNFSQANFIDLYLYKEGR